MTSPTAMCVTVTPATSVRTVPRVSRLPLGLSAPPHSLPSRRLSLSCSVIALFSVKILAPIGYVRDCDFIRMKPKPYRDQEGCGLDSQVVVLSRGQGQLNKADPRRSFSVAVFKCYQATDAVEPCRQSEKLTSEHAH